MTNDSHVHDTSVNDPTPQQLGFRWPAEWEPHAATWIAWPHNQKTWPNLFSRIPPVFEEFVSTIAEFERVHVLGGPPESHLEAESLFDDHPNVTVHSVTTSDCWIRDFGPTFLIDKERSKLAGVDWKFNAWGNKYEGYEDDVAGGQRVCDAIRCTRFETPFTCEGGALETDGRGTLLVTPQSCLTGNRNPGWARENAESHFKDMLSIQKVIWIENGSLAGDDTDSHIDQLVRFVAPGKVVCATTTESDVENSDALHAQREQLSLVTDASDSNLEVIDLPIPPPRFVQGQRVPESYCNFYVFNDAVVVPKFGHIRSDERAISILSDLFSDRKVIGLSAVDMIWGLGAYHCASQQQPATTND